MLICKKFPRGNWHIRPVRQYGKENKPGITPSAVNAKNANTFTSKTTEPVIPGSRGSDYPGTTRSNADSILGNAYTASVSEGVPSNNSIANPRGDVNAGGGDIETDGSGKTRKQQTASVR